MACHGPGDVRFFNRLAGAYDLLMPPARAADLQAGLAFAGRPIDRVVDLAGGTGRAARALRVDITPVVVDVSAGMLARAATAGLPAVRGDARQPPLRNGSVDAVLVVDALHHVPTPERALTAAAAALAPGGVLVLREFDPSTLRGRLVVAGEHAAGMDSQFFTPDALASAVEAAGLRSWVVERGFGYTVVGVKPETQDATPPSTG